MINLEITTKIKCFDIANLRNKRKQQQLKEYAGNKIMINRNTKGVHDTPKSMMKFTEIEA